MRHRSDMSGNQSRVVVVGAGVIGAAIAYELRRRGKRVTLLDRDEPGRGASYGNMASIAVTEFMPASRPSVWRRMPGWLLDPEGPIRLRPSYLPKLAPWLLRFLAASRPSRLEAIEAAGAALFGFPHDLLGGNAIRDLEPAISTRIKRAVLFPQNRSVRDPYELVLAMAQRFREQGGRIERGEVVAFDRSGNRIAGLRLRDGRRLAATEVVLCAGAFTGRLSKLIGEPIPLETERGYHTQIMASRIEMRHSIIWPARAFMVTPTAGGLRVGGTVEMAGLDAPPDFRRAKVLVKRAKEALPDLRADKASEWMGHRPALPDTVPVIGPSAKTQGVYYATGHGHLGVTYAATTARLIADLVTGAPPPIDMTPYRVDRF